MPFQNLPKNEVSKMMRPAGLAFVEQHSGELPGVPNYCIQATAAEVMIGDLCMESMERKVTHIPEDIHKKTASEMFGKPIEDITDDERRAGKATNFFTIYGGTAR